VAGQTVCTCLHVATDFIITITLSAADATAHIIENPLMQVFFVIKRSALRSSWWRCLQVFLRGFQEAIGLAVFLVGVYLLLNLVIISVGVYQSITHL